jgi:ABC-type phosphate/phosphonate transport system substrate-binding protein
VAVSLAGGRRYYLISKSAKHIAECKSQALATDHADDPRFIDAIVFDGDAKLSEFTLAATQRPLQTIKAVMTDKARCALIDDAQKDQLEHLHDKDAVRVVWESDELPPMPVVAFPAAPKAERERFKRNLDAVCNDEGKSACAEVGIVDLTGADDAEYAELVKTYGK